MYPLIKNLAVECCLYIVISYKFGYKTCILSVLARQVHVVYAYMNQGLFLNIVAMRKICTSKFSLKKELCLRTLPITVLYAMFLEELIGKQSEFIAT